MSERLHRAAVHEAGHAVIGRLLNLPCGGARIRDDGTGYAMVWAEDAIPRKYIMLAVAGGAAERLFFDDVDESVSALDRRRAHRRALANDYNAKQFSHVRRRATSLLTDHADAVRRVAAALLEYGSLSGKQIDYWMDNDDE
jgi:ATP-dependent Zn protease